MSVGTVEGNGPAPAEVAATAGVGTSEREPLLLRAFEAVGFAAGKVAGVVLNAVPAVGFVRAEPKDGLSEHFGHAEKYSARHLYGVGVDVYFQQ